VRRRYYVALIADIRRFRPLVAVALAVVAMLPTFDTMVRQGLPATSVLVRLVETLLFIGALVWLASGVVLHYARVQIQSDENGEFDHDR
jgi:hypothetical protein